MAEQIAGCVESAPSLAHTLDQRCVDLEGFVDLVDVAELVGLMALSGFAWANDVAACSKPGTSAEASVK